MNHISIPHSRLALRALVTYAVGGAALRLLYRIATRLRDRRRMYGTPAVGGHPLLGGFPELRRNASRRLAWLQEKFAAHGKDTMLLHGLLFADVGEGDQLITRSPAVVRHVLKDRFDDYVKFGGNPPLAFKTLWEMIGKGLVSRDHGPHAADGGRTWKTQRQLAVTMFTRDKFRDYYLGVFAAKAARVVELLQRRGPAEPVDVVRLFSAFTMDSFGVIAYNADMGMLDALERGVPVDAVPDPRGNGVYAHSFDRGFALLGPMMLALTPRLVLCGLLPPPLAALGTWLTKWTSAPYRAYRRHTRAVHAKSAEFIAQRRAAPEAPEQEDLLSLFMAADDERGVPFRVPSRAHDRVLRNVLLSFMLAGRDTTANTLVWLFYELAQPGQAEVLERLQAEIDSTLNGEAVTYDDIQKRLPYLKGVVYETLRLHPFVSQLILNAVKDDVWPDGTFCPARMNVRVSIDSVCRDPKLYPDPDTFQPTRWIPFREPPQAEFPIFKGGPRLCVGMQMAIFEASLVTVYILQKFTLHIVPGQDLRSGVGFANTIFSHAFKRSQMEVLAKLLV
eukprot:TRINITY_DN9970_c0_g1_i3.p1 TRINITY_DN9970_c0_g1~~TRINITY_DN9970_c0_g1_i3.p1  ORF type:complete len:561 (+),score=131.39 TRINITY_DN9970_c0_g1_i3:50-1732(+)